MSKLTGLQSELVKALDNNPDAYLTSQKIGGRYFCKLQSGYSILDKVKTATINSLFRKGYIELDSYNEQTERAVWKRTQKELPTVKHEDYEDDGCAAAEGAWRNSAGFDNEHHFGMYS